MNLAGSAPVSAEHEHKVALGGDVVTEQGTPAAGSTIARGIVLLDAETGRVLVSHWSGHG